jgi:myo-inositol-1(or 4)-monophosphatase
MSRRFLEVGIEAAKAAGRIQKRNLNGAFRVHTKGDVTNLVTEVDLRCEKRIVTLLRKHFPTHGIFAEEGGEDFVDSPYRWLIDPLDGTTNYAHGYPVFCTSIALEYRGAVVLGVVYDPCRQELFTAEKGRGALLNGHSITPSETSDLDAALLVTGFPYDVRKSKRNLDHFRRFSLRAQAVRRDGSAALDLCYTAMGRFDGFWEFSLSPWDMAAGSLILSEAGGRVTHTNGRTFSLGAGDILATNGRVHLQMLRILREGRS